MVAIIQKEHPTLRKLAEPVTEALITSTQIKKIIENMIVALESQDDGVAIAAPQINEPYRIFAVSHKVFDIVPGHKNRQGKNMIFINPVITKLSKDRKNLEEGCLSVRYLYGKVSRSHKATIQAQNEEGVPFSMKASGLLAQIFQHEIDHLNGILFIDTAKNVEEVLPQKVTHKTKAS